MFALMSSSVFSQVKEHHDDQIYDQFFAMEVGYRNLDGWPWILYGDYKNAANYPPLGSRIEQRRYFQSLVADEKNYADVIDSMYTSRAKKLSVETADRLVDTKWMTEGGRIESQLSSFERNISRITLSGGTTDEYRHWKDIYNMVARNAIPMVRESYQPGFKRMEEYQRILNDLRQYNEKLAGEFRYWNARKISQQVSSMGLSVCRTRTDSIARSCLGRWLLDYRGVSDRAPKAARVRYRWKESQ